MQVAYHAETLIDAHLARHALEDAGMPAFVLGESLLGGIGELPARGVLRVCVPDACLPEARDVLAALGLDGDPAAPILVGDEDGFGMVPA